MADAGGVCRAPCEEVAKHCSVTSKSVMTPWRAGASLGSGWRATNHLSRLLADSEDVIRRFVDGDDRGLEQDDPFATHEDDRVGRPKIDCEAAAMPAK